MMTLSQSKIPDHYLRPPVCVFSGILPNHDQACKDPYNY